MLSVIAKAKARLRYAYLWRFHYVSVLQFCQNPREVIFPNYACECFSHSAYSVFKSCCGQNGCDILGTIAPLIQNSSCQLNEVSKHFARDLMSQASCETRLDFAFYIL